jgi:hypothetical protein
MRRSIVSRIPVLCIGLLLSVSVLFVSGCGIFSSAKRETRLLYKGMEHSSGACQKIMAALPFENDVQWASPGLNTNFAPKVKKSVENECNDVILRLPGDPDFPARFNDPAYTADGELDSGALTAAGQVSGINLILSGRLTSIRHITEDRGMFWFAKVVHLARIQMEIAIYHTGTGAKVLNRAIFQDIKITEAEGELIDAGEMPKAIPLDEALAEISETLGKSAHNVLKHIPWEGYVSSVQGDRIVISAGAACGLKKGRELTVYNAAKVAVGDEAQTFISPGSEVGTITVTAVYPDRSEAALKYGGPVLPGSVLRAK